MPFRIYFGDLGGWGALGGIGLQAAGRWSSSPAGAPGMGRVMARLQVQGG